ncbi:hypothetical protein ACFWXO_30870 [Kitasatospora sp. NPDC059088]|uniref:hypothetical protein n=1 Tax=Kitasatospora sp. NPDC059088 TaxID=3346722 RepID=UPI00367D2C7E
MADLRPGPSAARRPGAHPAISNDTPHQTAGRARSYADAAHRAANDARAASAAEANDADSIHAEVSAAAGARAEDAADRATGVADRAQTAADQGHVALAVRTVTVIGHTIDAAHWAGQGEKHAATAHVHAAAL